MILERKERREGRRERGGRERGTERGGEIERDVRNIDQLPSACAPTGDQT